MKTVYCEPGAGESGDGSAGDPIHIDSTTDLDNLLNGTYTNGPAAAASGDIYIFKDGAYDGVRLNNADISGITLKAENKWGATIEWNTGGAAPIGVASAGTADFTVEGFKFTNDATLSDPWRFTGGDVTLLNCWIDLYLGGNDEGIDVISDTLTLDRCVIRYGASATAGTGIFRDVDNLTLTNCTAVLREAGYVFYGTTATVKNSIFYDEEGTCAWQGSSTITDDGGNYADNVTGLPAGVTDVDPLFYSLTNQDYRIRPGSTVVGGAV